MTILFICDEYPPGPCGGIGTYTRNMARELARRGHRVLVAGLYAPGFGGSDRETDEGVEVWRQRLPTNGSFGKGAWFMNPVLRQWLRRTGILRRQVGRAMTAFQDFLLQLIRDEQVDLVEWPDFSIHWNYLDPEDLRPLPVPLLVRCHGAETYLRSMTGRPFRPSAHAVERAHLLRANQLLAVSRFTAEQYQRFFTLDLPPAVCYNGVPCPDAPPRNALGQKLVVYSGSLTRPKGVDSLMRAWNEVHRAEPGARLILYGKGKDQPFRRLIRQGAGASVTFAGFVDHDRLRQAYEQAALAVFPSRVESFALAPLEAMALGCPVIYTERASGPELIRQGANGLLVDPDDPAALAEAICRMLRDRTWAEGLGQAGRFHVKSSLDLHQIASIQEEAYRQLLADRAAAGGNREAFIAVY